LHSVETKWGIDFNICGLGDKELSISSSMIPASTRKMLILWRRRTNNAATWSVH
jgi:hypothetical protein